MGSNLHRVGDIVPCMMMENQHQEFWFKAEENLASARSEYVNGRFNACANRLYYAAFHAAVVALLDARLPARTGTWGHDYVQAQFTGNLINRRKIFPPDFRDTLIVLRELRTKADYRQVPVRRHEAARALGRSEAFVNAIATRRGNR